MSQEEAKKDLIDKNATDEKENLDTSSKVIEQNKQEEIQNDSYTVKIVPDKTDNVKVFTVTKSMLKYVIVSAVALFALVVASLGFAGYTYINSQSDKEHIRELQQANTLQQEQLSRLDKKANSLQQNMDELSNLENELKQLSGISTSDDNNSEQNVDTNIDETKGQGGPYQEQSEQASAVKIENIRNTLDSIEQKLNGKKNNMQELKQSLQRAIMMKRQQAAIANETISTTPSIWPSSGVVSSPYGLRWGGSDFHPGIDIADDMGTPIRATADGVVSVAGWNSGGYGNMVDIDHGNGIMTRYGHASYVVVNAGQHVKRGQIIAYMGSTGFSTGPHVHYEVRVNGQAVNPAGYLFN